MKKTQAVILLLCSFLTGTLSSAPQSLPTPEDVHDGQLISIRGDLRLPAPIPEWVSRRSLGPIINTWGDESAGFSCELSDHVLFYFDYIKGVSMRDIQDSILQHRVSGWYGFPLWANPRLQGGKVRSELSAYRNKDSMSNDMKMQKVVIDEIQGGVMLFNFSIFDSSKSRYLDIEKYIMAEIKKDPMILNSVHPISLESLSRAPRSLPGNLKEAAQIIYSIMSKEQCDTLKQFNYFKDYEHINVTLFPNGSKASQLLSTWGLTSESPFSRYIYKLGVKHFEDVHFVLNFVIWKLINGEKVDNDKTIVREYYAGMHKAWG